MLPLLIFLATFGRFAGAADLDYDIEGNIYVLDRTGNTLVKYSPRGDSLRAVSGLGTGSLQFDTPVALSAQRGNDIFVADYNNHRVQRFDRTLDYVTTIQTRDDPDERRRFGYPRDVAVTRQGDILIVDGENRRIIKFNAVGQVQGIFGDVNAGAGRLVEPSKIAVDSRDNAYVLDRERLVMFDPFGSYVRDLDLPLGAVPHTLAIDRDTLVVADSSTVAVYDLKTGILDGTYDLPAPAVAVHLIGGRLVALEAKRVAVYSFDYPQAEGGE
jgi:sugar lactone lactonase YvrE